jgi:hypothetical protein
VAFDRLAAKRVPDVIEGIIPSGIMTLAVTDHVPTAEAVWEHGRRCVHARELFLGSRPTRRGGIEVLRPAAGAPHGLRPTPMYMATALVWTDLCHLTDLDEIDVRIRELSEVFGRMALQHWHAVQPAFVVAIPDVFECGPFGVLDLAESFFGRLALGAVYVEARGADAPAIVVRGREGTVSCMRDRAGAFWSVEGGDR